MFPLRQYREGFRKQELKDKTIRQEFDGVNFAYKDVKLSKKKNTNNFKDKWQFGEHIWDTADNHARMYFLFLSKNID